jgi:cytochrome c oxidase assembly protein subunit 15
MLWIALEYLRLPASSEEEGTSKRGISIFWPSVIAVLVYVQMLLGALVAGLHAGYIYNTWPLMDGRLGPEDVFAQSPWWLNFFENPGTAQFDHRIGAYIVALAVFALWWNERRLTLPRPAKRSGIALVHLTIFQIALGITTLLLQAPEFLAALHQLTAALLLCTAVWHAFELRYAAKA